MLMLEDLQYNDEDPEYIEKTRIKQERFQAKVRIPEWLEHAESPYKWLKSLSVNFINYSHERMLNRLDDIQNQETDYEFEKFIILLTTLCMDSLAIGFITEEAAVVKVDPEASYLRLEAVLEEMRSREGDKMYRRIGPALEHLLAATRANMLYLMGKDEESMQTAKKIVAAENMDLQSQAGFESVKAGFFEHIYRDGRSLPASQKAEALDPTFPFWKYTTAKIMRYYRRESNKDVTQEEIDYLEAAVNMERNPKFLLSLAQVYQEMAQLLLNRRTKVLSAKPKAEKMYRKAVELYREIWRLKNDSAPIARRVGLGLQKIKSKCKDIRLAEEALLKAVELSPTYYTGHHALVKLYLFHLQDEEKALQYLNVPIDWATYPTREMILYKLAKDMECDISEYIKRLVEIAETCNNDSVYCDIAWYHLYFKQDIKQAIQFLWKVLKKNAESPEILKFSSYPFMVKNPVNLLEVFLNEILLSMEDCRERPGQFKSDVVLTGFLEKVYEKHPHLREWIPDPALLPEISRNVDISRGYIIKSMYINRCFNSIHCREAQRN